MQTIVGFARKPDRGLRIEFLGRRLGMRYHLEVDTGLVHRLEPDFAEILKASKELGVTRAFARCVVLRKFGVLIMLLESDDAGFGLSGHRRDFLRAVF
jgi:hypothetical protein